MQIPCYCFDAKDVLQRPDAQAVIREMIETDDIDLYATYLPDQVRPSHSARTHFAVAEALKELISASDPPRRAHLGAVSQLISTGESIDDLGLSPLTYDVNFMSLSPGSVARLHEAFASLGIEQITELHQASRPEATDEFIAWLLQWKGALVLARDTGLAPNAHRSHRPHDFPAARAPRLTMADIGETRCGPGLTGASFTASAWWGGGPRSGMWDNWSDFFGDGMGDFNMSMSGGGHGSGRS